MTTDPTESHPPRPTRRTPRRWLAPVITGAAGFAIGFAIYGGGHTAPPAATPTAAPSRDCTEALGLARRVMALDNQAFGAAGEAMKAAALGDTDTINANAAKIRAITPDKQAATALFDSAAADCTGTP
jgi:hypothetical protein